MKLHYKLLCFALLALLARPVSAQTLLHHYDTTSSPITITATTAGSLLLVVSMTNSANVTAITDSASQTYTRDADCDPTGSSERRIIVYRKENSAAGVTSVTVTNAGFTEYFVEEYSGMVTSGSLDVATTGATGTSATLTENITTNATDVIFTMGAANDATPASMAAANSFTMIDKGAGGKSWGVADRENVAASTYSPKFTVAGSVAWDICTVSYKVNSSTAPTQIGGFLVGP